MQEDRFLVMVLAYNRREVKANLPK